MPSLDDYAPPSSLWLTICAVLSRSADGLSVTQCATEVTLASKGRHARASAVGETLRKMRDDGFVRMKPQGRGRVPSLIHTLTPVGRELYLETRQQVLALLDPSTKKKG